MKNLIYAPKPESNNGELRLITRSLLLLALLTAILYIRVFLTVTPSSLDLESQGISTVVPILLLLLAILGLLLAWKWEGLGGILVVVSGVGLAILTFISATNAPWLTAFFYGSPFVITGCLCLVCRWRKI